VLDGQARQPVDDFVSLRLLATSISEQPRSANYEWGTGSFAFGLLPAGRWRITASAFHAWSLVFPGLQLYADTSLVVDVIAGESIRLPDVLLRPRAPLLLVAIKTCGPIRNAPSPEDWTHICEGGYWGGAQVRVKVQGIPGTSTADVYAEADIGPAEYQNASSSWEKTPWSTHFDITVEGEYDVTILRVAPRKSGETWRLLSWQEEPQRVRVGKGLSYIEFGFWHK